MSRSRVFLYSLLVGLVATHTMANPSTKIIQRFDSAAAVKKWMANPGASVEWVAGDNRAGWMQVKLNRYTGEGNAWPGAGCSTAGVNLLEATGLGFTVHNPEDHTQAIQVSIAQTGGNAGADLFTIPPRTTQRFISRFNAMSAPVEPALIESVTLYRTQPESDVRLLIKDVFLEHGDAGSTTFGQLRQQHKQLSRALRACRSDNLLPDDRVVYLSGVVREWAAALKSPEAIAPRVEECRSALTAALAEARSAVLREKHQRPIIAWEGSVGRTLIPAEAIAELDTPLDRLEIDVLNGAYSHGIVRLTNVDTQPADLLVEWETADDWTRDHSVFWRTGNVVATDRTIVADALIPLDAVGGLTIAPGETVELWVRLDARTEPWPAATHDGRLRLRNLRRPNADLRLPVSIRATGIDLPAKAPLRLVTWPDLFAGRSAVVRGMEDRAARNLADYGADVVTLSQNELPWPKIDAQGALTEPIDFTAFDQRVGFYLEHIPDATFLCWVRIDIPDPNRNFELRSELTAGSEAWERGVRTWISEWREHLVSQGWRPERFGFYLADEPGTEELDRHIAMARLMREAAPDMPIYANPSELYDDPAKTALLLDHCDIVQPDATLGFERNPKMIEALQEHESIDLWVYACRTGRRGRAVNPHAYYRLQAWHAMQQGLGGIGFWAYSSAHGDPNELWNGTAAPGAGATLVYRGNDRLIMSRRWELIRDSLDDARLIQLLEEHGTPAATELKTNGLIDVLGQPNDAGAVDRWRQEVIELLRNPTP